MTEPATQTEHSAPGGTVTETGCRRRDGRVQRLPCGCSCDDFRWLTFCERVAYEFSVRRSRWQAEHVAHAHKAEPIDPLLE